MKRVYTILGWFIFSASYVSALSIHDPLIEVRLPNGLAIETNATLADVLQYCVDMAQIAKDFGQTDWRPDITLAGATRTVTICSSPTNAPRPDYAFDPTNNPRCTVDCQRELYLRDALNMATHASGTRWQITNDTLVVYFPSQEELSAESKLLSASCAALLVRGQHMTKLHLISYIEQFPSKETKETLLRVALNKAESEQVRQNALLSLWCIVSPSDSWTTLYLQKLLGDKDSRSWCEQTTIDILLITEAGLRKALPPRPDVWDPPDWPVDKVMEFLKRKNGTQQAPGTLR